MTDPVRLLEGGSTDFEADLLRAGRADGMSDRSRKQILAGIGIGGLLTASTVTTGARAGVKAWLAAATVGVAGVAVWAGVHATTVTPPAAPPPSTPPARAPIAAAPAVATAAPAKQPDAVSPAERAPASPAPPAPKPASRAAPAVDRSLTAELSALEQARRAFLAHDYTQTLRLLDEYTRRFTKRRLGTEAKVLRIETLAARGDRETAARVGRDFLQSHPNGPYAQRVRSVIGESDTSSHAP